MKETINEWMNEWTKRMNGLKKQGMDELMN